jgi:hypothetical protein
MFFFVVIYSLKRYLVESFSLLELFALHSLWGVGIMRVIYAVHKDVDVVLPSVLLYMTHWLVGFSTLLD